MQDIKILIAKNHGIEQVFPCVYQRTILEDYFIDNTGQIYNTKVYPYGEKMRYTYSETKKYPRVKFIDYSDLRKMPRLVAVHRIVAETFIPFEKPNEIAENDWANTPDAVKNFIFDQLDVNHKDSNRLNYHPSNLEWVTGHENNKHYQEKVRMKVYKKPVFINPNKPEPGCSLEHFFESAAA